MKDQVLSIDQMKHLKDLDIDTSEATLYWTRRCHGYKIDDDSTGEWFLSLQKEFQVIGFMSYEVIPTLPSKIGSSGDYVHISSSGDDCVIMCAGINSSAKAKIGSWITLAEWKYSEEKPDFKKLPVLLKHKSGVIHFIDSTPTSWKYLIKHYVKWYTSEICYP